MAYREELEEKKAYMAEALERLPELRERMDPLRDVHNCTLTELKVKVSWLAESAKMARAATSIQRIWR